MIREIVVPKASDIILHLPADMVGRKIKVIAFAVDEPTTTDPLLTHFAGETILAKDWLTKEEDTAWQDL